VEGECSTHERHVNCIQKFGRKSDEKRSCGRPRRRWEGNIRMDLKRNGGKVWTGFIWPSIRTNMSRATRGIFD
jgi:hypothetical protein